VVNAWAAVHVLELLLTREAAGGDAAAAVGKGWPRPSGGSRLL
jgi:hypothetical protein